MQIVSPVTTFDLKLLGPQIDVLEYLGGVNDFNVVISPSVEAAPHLEPYIERLRLISNRVDVLRTDYQEAGSWPLGPNKHWVQTVYAMDMLRPNEPGDCWFWHELDCWPIDPKWAYKLSDAYAKGVAAAKAGGKNSYFLGKIVKTPFRTGDGRITHDPEGFDDSMMMGCAVYCAGMSKNPFWQAQANSLRDWSGSIGGMKQPEAWDLEMRTFFRNSGWTHTDLIGDRWNTINYRVEDGVLKCDAGPTQFKNRSHNETDITGASLIHGCKDESLSKLILDGFFGKKVEPVQTMATIFTGHTPTVTTSAGAAKHDPPVALVQTPTQNLRIEALEVKVESMDGSMRTMLGLLQKLVNEKPSVSPHVVQGEPAQARVPLAHETKAETEPVLTVVERLVVGKRAVKLKEIADHLDKKQDEISPIISSSENFEIYGGKCKYVKRRAA